MLSLMKTVIDCGDDKNFVFILDGAKRKENLKAKNYTQSQHKGDYSLQRYPLSA